MKTLSKTRPYRNLSNWPRIKWFAHKDIMTDVMVITCRTIVDGRVWEMCYDISPERRYVERVRGMTRIMAMALIRRKMFLAIEVNKKEAA